MPTYDKHHRLAFFQWYDHESPDGPTHESILTYCNAPGSSRRSVSTCYRWIKERAQHGRWGPLRKRRKKNFSCLPHAHVMFLLNYFDNVNPCIGLIEMMVILEEEFHVHYSRQQIGSALKFSNYSQKTVEYTAIERDEEARAYYLNTMRPTYAGGLFSSDMLVYMDETHVNEKKARMRLGWSRRGTPVKKIVRRAIGLAGANSGLCAMNTSGMLCVRVVNTRADGTVDRVAVENWLVEDLLPRMNAYPAPNSVLIMDGASVHNGDAIEALCQQRGILVLYLPAYSPDYNPIELVFSAVKRKLRKVYDKYPQMNANELKHAFEFCLVNSCSPEHAIAYYDHCHIVVTAEERAQVNEWNNIL